MKSWVAVAAATWSVPRCFRWDELSLPVPSLGPEQMLLQQLLEQLIDSAAPLRKDALNRAAPGGNPIFEDDPITTHPQPVILLQRAFERANVATPGIGPE